MELQAQQQHTEAARLAADSVLAAARQEIASLERQLHSALSRAAALDDAVTDGGLLSDIQAKVRWGSSRRRGWVLLAGAWGPVPLGGRLREGV